MNDSMVAMSPRRLVVLFDDGSDLSEPMIRGDKGNRPQLVHKQKIHRASPPPPPPSLSGVDRLLRGLRVKRRPLKEPEVVDHPNDQAIADAHAFVSDNYRPGDEVILLIYQGNDGDHLIKAMEILARHLHDGTTPSELSKVQSGGEDAPGKRIPIHAVAVLWWNGSTESASLMNDGLKSRFPPGIQHFICSAWSDFKHWSCSTVLALDGSTISRKISVYDHLSSYWDGSIHATKHIVYCKPWWIPDWDKQKPVWTKVLDSSSSGITRNYPLTTLPAGVYRHELSSYQGGSRGSDRLVWKSFRY